MKKLFNHPIVKILEVLLILLLLAYVLKPFFKDSDKIVEILKSFNIIFLALGFFLLSFVVSMYPLIWRSILSKFGTKITVDKAYKSWIYSNVGKYMPGKIWQFAGRVMLTKEAYGEVIIFTILLETVIAGVAAIIVFLWGALVGGIFTAKWVKYLSITLPILIALLHPYFLKQILKILSKIRKLELHGNFTMKYRDILMYLVFYIILWILTGTAFRIMIQDSNLEMSLIDLASSYALSWILGYAAIFSPAGVGVREGAIVFFLGLKYTHIIASSFAILTRLSFILNDFFLFGLLFIYLNFKKLINRNKNNSVDKV
ncbi:hypothetical protein KAU43_05740 [candidate division WOR-3 bacterium]|nr:hypothetical protein [candidate division WOR-3 bacterium]